MENKFHDLGDVIELTYLLVNNPWRWSGNIENLLNNSSEKEFFQMYREICFVYDRNSSIDDKFFRWGFEEIFEKRVIEPEIEIKKYGAMGEGIADEFVDTRKKIHNQTLSDYKKIYALWKKIGIKRGFNISFYPNDLDELFN